MHSSQQRAAGLLVVGPHRSGTSAAARLINLCGFYLGEPESLLPANAANQRGYWEPRWLVHFNDDLLALFGGDWRTSGPIDPDTLPPELLQRLLDRAGAWAGHMSRHGRWACKDPRLCLTAPLWTRVLPEAPVLVSVRHPGAAVASLMRRTTDRIENRNRALDIWRRYFLGAVNATAGRPHLVLDYDRLLLDGEGQLERLVAWLRERDPAFEPPADLAQRVAQEIEPDLSRHSSDDHAQGFCDATDLEAHQALLAGDEARLERILTGWPGDVEAFDLRSLPLRRDHLAWQAERLSLELAGRIGQAADLSIRVQYLDERVAQLEHRVREIEDEARKIEDEARAAREAFQRSRSRRLGHAILTPARVARNLFARSAPPSPPATDVEEPSQIISSRYASLRARPLISLLMTVHDTPRAMLEQSIQSVRDQTYGDWELCVTDAGCSEPSTLLTLDALRAEADPRFKLRRLERPVGVAAGIAAAAGTASGEFVALLDPRDLLEPDALVAVAERLEQAPDADLLYSDDDSVFAEGARQAFHKPDYSPEHLLSCNYIRRLAVIRSSVFEQAGGVPGDRDGSIDFDLYLRVTELARRIEHVPEVLYHARPDEAAPDGWADSARSALRAAVSRRGWDAKIRDGSVAGTYRVEFSVDPSSPVTIIIPIRDRVELLESCVRSIRRYTRHPAYEILVVCNNCRERATFDYLRQASGEGVLRYLRHDIPFNYAKLINHGVRESDSPFLLLLNNDVEATHSGWLSAMLEYAQRDKIGAVGAKLLYPNQTIQHAGMVIGIMGSTGHAHRGMAADRPGYCGIASLVRNCSAVTGACLMTRRGPFEEVGGFTERFAIGFNDVDYCLKLERAGYRVVYTPHATLYHEESRSRGRDDAGENAARFRWEIVEMLEIWGDRMRRDPYYNPNLTLWEEDFSPRTQHDQRLQGDFLDRLRSETGFEGTG